MVVNIHLLRYTWMQVAFLLTGIFNSILIARFLSTEQYGAYSLIMKSTNIAVIVFSFGIGSAIQNDPKFLFLHKKSLLVFLFLAILLQSVGIYLYSKLTLHNQKIAYCAVVLGVTNLLLLIISNYEIAVGETNKLFYTRTFMPIMLTITLTLVAVLKIDYFLELINIVILVVSLNLAIIFRRLITFKAQQVQHHETVEGEIRQYFIFGLQTFPALAIRSFHLSLDLLLLGFLLSPTKLSEYAICITIGGLSSLPLFIYSTDKQVRFKNMSLRDGRTLIIKRVFGQCVPISICWSISIFAFVYFNNGDFIFSISTNAMLILILIILANIVDGVALLYSSLAISNGFNNQNTRIQTTGFLINMIAMIILVPHFLGIGAAAASIISYSYCLVQMHKRIR